MGWDFNRAAGRASGAGSVDQAPAVDQGAATTRLTSVFALGALVVAFIAGYVVLAATGRDPLPYIVFLSGPAVSGVVGVILARHQGAIAADVSAVRHQTNSMMTDQFQAAHEERQALAGQSVTVTKDTDTVPLGQNVTVT